MNTYYINRMSNALPFFALLLLTDLLYAAASPLFERTARRLLTTTPPASPEPTRRVRPHLLPDLGQAYKRFRSGQHPKAIIVGPFVTIVKDIEQMAGTGTDVVVLTTPDGAKKLSKRFKQGLSGSKIVIRQSPAAKTLHDKAILLQNKDGSWDGYFGSANPSYNQFRSNELVIQLENIGENSASLIQHIQRLARISESPDVPRRVPGQGRQRMLQTMRQLQTHQGLPSSQQAASFVATDPVQMIVQQMSGKEACDYKISSMGLNHPAVVPALQTALEVGSTIQLLLDQGSVERALHNPRSEISRVIQLRKRYPALQVKMATGKGRTGIHHAKLFIRTCDDEIDALHMTHNLTSQAASQTNYTLRVPSWPPTNWQQIEAYENQFDSWWDRATSIDLP